MKRGFLFGLGSFLVLVVLAGLLEVFKGEHLVGALMIVLCAPLSVVAIRKANEALTAKLPEVGVLDSGEFSSLHPGYYVVFSGIYPDQRGALNGIGRVQALYPAAYIRQISH